MGPLRPQPRELSVSAPLNVEQPIISNTAQRPSRSGRDFTQRTKIRSASHNRLECLFFVCRFFPIYIILSGWHFTDILVDPALKQLRFSRRTLASTEHSQNSSLHCVAERGGKVLPHVVMKLNSTLRMIITPGCKYQSNRRSCKQGFKR